MYYYSVIDSRNSIIDLSYQYSKIHMQVVHYELAELRKAMGSYSINRTMESYGIAMVKLWQSYGRATVEL